MRRSAGPFAASEAFDRGKIVALFADHHGSAVMALARDILTS